MIQSLSTFINWVNPVSPTQLIFLGKGSCISIQQKSVRIHETQGNSFPLNWTISVLGCHMVGPSVVEGAIPYFVELVVYNWREAGGNVLVHIDIMSLIEIAKPMVERYIAMRARGKLEGEMDR